MVIPNGLFKDLRATTISTWLKWAGGPDFQWVYNLGKDVNTATLVSRNATVTVSLFAFLWAWSDFVFAATLDGGGAHQPIALGIYRYIGNNNQEWNSIMATAVVASVPTAVLLVLAQRYVAAGVTAGSVKE